MKKSIYLSLLALSTLSISSAATTVYSHWDNFSALESQSGTQNNTVVLNGGLTANNGILHFDGSSGSFASIAFTSGTEMGWLSGKTSCLQLTITGLQLENQLSQIFLYQGKTSSGIAAGTNGLITDGNNTNSYGSSFAKNEISGTFTLTIAQNTSGTAYYLNGELIHTESKWLSSNSTWSALQLGNAYSYSGGSHNGASFDLLNMELFSVDSTNAASVAAAIEERYKALPVSVPEPGTVSLGLIGFAALLMRRRII